MGAHGSLTSGAAVDPWHVMRYVSGLPRDEARRRIMVMLQAYMDESGNWGDTDKDEAFVIAGFISTAERWQQFSEAWAATGWPKTLKGRHLLNENRQNRLGNLNMALAMVESSALYRVECAVDLRSYRRAKNALARGADNPYFYGFHESIARIATTVLAADRQYSGTIDIFFDKNLIFGRRCEKWYDLARYSMSPRLNNLLPENIIFKDDDEFLPLKASDLLVGAIRRDYNPEAGTTRTIERLNAIPGIDSPMLGEEYFQAAITAPSIAIPDEWRERWDMYG